MLLSKPTNSAKAICVRCARNAATLLAPNTTAYTISGTLNSSMETICEDCVLPTDLAKQEAA